MADCHKHFLKFDEEIRLSNSKKNNLQQSRDANRDRIEKYFADDLELKKPDFYQQGSFSLKTVVNPLSGEYDIDDGVYLTHINNESIDEWPSADKVHGWIAKSVEGATKARVVKKNNCVRVTYAADYHVDLPVYGEYRGDIYLFTKNADEPVQSDPKKYREWFLGLVNARGEQLRRIVRYLKAWNDYNSSFGYTGVLLTTMAAYYLMVDERDDVSFINTVASIVSAVNATRKIQMPTEPYDDLLDGWSDSRIDRLVNRLNNLYEEGKKANDEEDEAKATEIWSDIFGDRFEVVDDNNDEGGVIVSAAAAPIVKPTKPWFGYELVLR